MHVVHTYVTSFRLTLGENNITRKVIKSVTTLFLYDVHITLFTAEEADRSMLPNTYSLHTTYVPRELLGE